VLDGIASNTFLRQDPPTQPPVIYLYFDAPADPHDIGGTP